jgi:mannose-6-phosphate isomerase-like protein (cupin superfamily)
VASHAEATVHLGLREGEIMKMLPVLALLLLTAVTVTADGVPTSVTYIPHDKVSATMAKGGSILNDHGLIILAQRRGAGEVELHEKTNHVFIIVEGEAEFVVGGTMVDAKQTAPDQRRAPSSRGGQTYHLTKGDVITIPAKTPHWFKEVSTQTIAYYAVNIEP